MALQLKVFQPACPLTKPNVVRQVDDLTTTLRALSPSPLRDGADDSWRRWSFSQLVAVEQAWAPGPSDPETCSPSPASLGTTPL